MDVDISQDYELLKKENILVKQENLLVKEENILVKEENILVKQENILIRQDNNLLRQEVVKLKGENDLMLRTLMCSPSASEVENQDPSVEEEEQIESNSINEANGNLLFKTFYFFAYLNILTNFKALSAYFTVQPDSSQSYDPLSRVDELVNKVVRSQLLETTTTNQDAEPVDVDAHDGWNYEGRLDADRIPFPSAAVINAVANKTLDRKDPNAEGICNIFINYFLAFKRYSYLHYIVS